MKKIITMFCIGVLLLFNIEVINAKDAEIPLDNSYIEDVITTWKNEETSREENEIKKYSFQLEEPGKIDLHFISHIDKVRFQIKDIDENVIKDEYIYRSESPQDYSLVLDKGIYTLHIIKIPYADENVGTYKFKMNYTDILAEGQSYIGDLDTISAGKTYKGFFQSKDDDDSIENTSTLNIDAEGKYLFTFLSDMNMSYSIRDIDENEIDSGDIYANEKAESELELKKGTYYLIRKTSDSGEYQINIEGKDIIQDEEKDKDKEKSDNKDNTTEEGKKTILDKFISPSTAVGALVITILGGLVVAYFTKNKE